MQKILFVLVLVLMQTSFLPILGMPFARFDFVLACFVFWGFLINFREAIIYAVIVGIVLEIYSAFAFGAILLGLLVSMAVCNWIFLSALTNRSLYTIIILMFLATLIYHFVFWIYAWAAEFFQSGDLLTGLFGHSLVNNLMYTEVMNVAFVTLLYFIFSLTARQTSAK
ncbi:hypothetical protein HY932_01855 [Candidatus Falkowbacteria bacterium]|nr:hypothetical protein [Candidatus Falkowbacteria bacterium]